MCMFYTYMQRWRALFDAAFRPQAMTLFCESHLGARGQTGGMFLMCSFPDILGSTLHATWPFALVLSWTVGEFVPAAEESEADELRAIRSLSPRARVLAKKAVSSKGYGKRASPPHRDTVCAHRDHSLSLSLSLLRYAGRRSPWSHVDLRGYKVGCSCPPLNLCPLDYAGFGIGLFYVGNWVKWLFYTGTSVAFGGDGGGVSYR